MEVLVNLTMLDHTAVTKVGCNFLANVHSRGFTRGFSIMVCHALWPSFLSSTNRCLLSGSDGEMSPELWH